MFCLTSIRNLKTDCQPYLRAVSNSSEVIFMNSAECTNLSLATSARIIHACFKCYIKQSHDFDAMCPGDTRGKRLMMPYTSTARRKLLVRGVYATCISKPYIKQTPSPFFVG